jgi:hypothetical protein
MMPRFTQFLTAMALALCLARADAAEAGWLRAESPNFVVYGEMREEELRAKVAVLEDFDSLLRSLTATKAAPPTKLNVYLVRGTGQLRRILPVGSGVAGFYAKSPDGIIAVSDQGAFFDSAADDTLLHEYAHHFMYQYYPATYPAWFTEGFAEYMMTAEFKPGVVEYGRPNRDRSDWLSYKWIPLDKVLHTDPGDLEGDEVVPFYAQSWLTVHYILRDDQRRAALAQYLEAIGKGKDSRASFAAAFGMGVLDFQSALREYALEGGTYTRRTRASASRPVSISISRLPASADELVLRQAGLRLGPSPDNCRHHLRAVRSEAEDHEDAFASRVLAHAEAICGDKARANALLDPLIRVSPGDAELLYLRGMSDLLAANADETKRPSLSRSARDWFGRAHKADGNYFPALYRYAQSLWGTPDFLSDNTLNVMLLARQIAPQVEEIAIDTARLLMLKKRFADAEVVLAPIAARAHGGKVAKLAEALMVNARRGVNNGPNIIPFVHPEED